MKIKLTTIVLLLLAATLISAQERLTPEEMFRWFPEGKYEGITFKDNQAAQTMQGFQRVLAVAFINRGWEDDLHLPASLKGKWLTMVQMHSIKIVVSITDKKVKTARGGRLLRFKVDDKTYNSNSFGHKMQVIRFPQELDLRKLALSQQGVSATESSFGDIPVYFAKLDSPTKIMKDYFFCITPENEILACQDKALLERMVKAGAGELPSLIDDFPFQYAWELLPEQSHYWIISDWTASFNAVFKKMEENEVDNGTIEKLAFRRSYMPPTITSYLFCNDPVRQIIRVYDSVEIAGNIFKRKHGTWGKRSPGISMSDNLFYNQQNTQLACEDVHILETTTFSKEYAAEYFQLTTGRALGTSKENAEKAQNSKKSEGEAK